MLSHSNILLEVHDTILIDIWTRNTLFFFFLISKKIILKKLKRAKTTQRIQRGEQKGKREEKRKTENKNIKKPAKTNHKEEN